jgi:hypothetical protein
MIKFKINQATTIFAGLWTAFILAFFAYLVIGTTLVGQMSVLTIVCTLALTWGIVTVLMYFSFKSYLIHLHSKFGKNFSIIYNLSHTTSPAKIFQISGSKVTPQIERQLRIKLALRIAAWLGAYALTGFFIAVPMALLLMQAY